MVAQPLAVDKIYELVETGFASLESKPDRPLCLPGFESGEFDSIYRKALHYVRSLIKDALRDEVGSPIFHFVIQEDMTQLSTGAKKWVGIIPREITAETAQRFAEQAAQKLTNREKKRLKLKGENVNKLKGLIQNTITSILHYNLKAARSVAALNVALDGEKNFVSYETLEEKVRGIDAKCLAIEDSEGRELNKKEYDYILSSLLKELGTLDVNADQKTINETIATLSAAKSDAWKLYKWLGENIKDAQEKADISGPIADIDINSDHPSLHLIEHLRAMYGRSKHYGTTVEDRYELQTAGNLTWLMARLSTHPVYKNLIEHKDDTIHNFMRKVYHEGKLFKKNEYRKIVHLDKKNRHASPGLARNTWDPEVYDSLIEGFDDLSTTTKQVYRGDFRDKDKLSIMVKAVKDRKELDQIVDALAGEAVMMGIEEKDLDPSKNENAQRLQAFMTAQAEAIATATGLTRAPEATDYNKIPVGTFKVVPKLEATTNSHSFNFPVIKIYFNIPVGEACDISPVGECISVCEDLSANNDLNVYEDMPVCEDSTVGDMPLDEIISQGDKVLCSNQFGKKSIRTEYRLICLDTWLRANKQTDSMSHHDNYKMKQGVDLLDIKTARAYNDTIHPVATKVRESFKRKERRELRELQKRSKAQIVSPHSQS